MNDIYENLIENITKRLKFDNYKDLIAALADATQNSTSSIYNKIAGRSKLSIEELLMIAEKYDLSIDELLKPKKNSKYVPYYADGLKYNPRSYNDYIRNILCHYQFVKSQNNVHGYFLTNDIPLFHILDFPFLLYLKLYVSNRSNWQIQGISRQFDYNSFQKDTELKQSVKYLKELYRTLPNSEIWHYHIIDNFIAIFKHFQDMNVISDFHDVSLFKKEIALLIDYMEGMCYTGQKPSNSKNQNTQIQIYLSEIALGSELLLIKSDNQSVLFQQIDVPNYMYTLDERMILKQKKYFDNVQNSSYNITKSNEKERSKFFNYLRQVSNSL